MTTKDNSRRKGKVVRRASTGFDKVFSEERHGHSELLHKETAEPYRKTSDPTGVTDRRYRGTQKNLVKFLPGYTGDRIGVINIASMIPHFRKRRK